jgi:hypothetical protein
MALAFGPQLALSSQNRQPRAALWAVVGVCFVIQPALTLALVLLLAWRQPAARGIVPSVLLLGALYLGLVNVTKMPESDLATYLKAFDDAQQLDFTTFLIVNVREPLYYVSLYGLANLPGVDGRVYLFLSSLLPYLVFGTAVLRICAALRLDGRSQVSLLVFLLFFPQLFSLSAHLLRQMLAASLLMLFLADQAVTGRRRWGLGLLGVFMHYSAMPFLVLSLFQPLKQCSRVVNLLFQVLTLVAVYVLAVQAAPLFFDVPVLGFVFQRLVTGEGAMLDPLTLPVLGTAVLYLAISLFSLTRTAGRTLGAQDWAVMLCTVTVCVVVLIFSLQPTLSEIAVRYYFYLYFLMGLVFPFVMVRVPRSRLLVHALALLCVPLFFFKLASGEWTFAPIIALLFEPAWMLWGHLASSLV